VQSMNASYVCISETDPSIHLILLQQPGPFPITNFDLAEFSLNALKTEKLYNTCPYVVQDY
jgi:hypothetical protein